MLETVFERSYPMVKLVAGVRAASIVTLYRLPADFRHDLEQEALLELWRKHLAYDPRRGSWRTFSERVVANRMASLVRAMRSERSGQFKEDPLETVLHLAAPGEQGDLCPDVSRVLAGMSPFDRSVAFCLVGYSAIETSQRLGVSRATVYRAIWRLRAAFTEAGLSPSGRDHACDSERTSTSE